MNPLLITYLSGLAFWFLLCLVGELVDDMILTHCLRTWKGGSDWMRVNGVRLCTWPRLRMHAWHAIVGAVMAEAILVSLRASNDLIDKVTWLVKHHMDLMSLKEMRRAKLRRLLANENVERLLAVHRADCLGSNGDLSDWEKAREFLATIDLTEPKRDLPKPLVTGDDLIALGMKPGPIFREILDQMLDQQLEGATREQLLEQLSSIAQSQGITS